MENPRISGKIDSLGIVKAAYDCAVAGKGLYGNPFSEEERHKSILFYGELVDSRINELEDMCLKESFDFNVALLRVDVKREETLRRARTPDASDRGPTVL